MNNGVIDPEVKRRLTRKLDSMKSRCYHPSNKDYRLYGGKGIGICEEWRKSADRFIEWAIENGYELGLTIERYDTNKGYSPENCTFIPMSRQPFNTSRNRYIRYKGEIHTISEVAKSEGVTHEAIRKRVKHGWYEEVPNPYKRLSESNTLAKA